MFGAKKDRGCPFWRGPCIKHDCQLYVNLKGKNPQGEEIIDQWGCSFKFLPWLLTENSQMQRQTGAAVESFRNENAAVNRVALDALESLIRVARLEAPSELAPKLIDGS